MISQSMFPFTVLSFFKVLLLSANFRVDNILILFPFCGNYANYLAPFFSTDTHIMLYHQILLLVSFLCCSLGQLCIYLWCVLCCFMGILEELFWILFRHYSSNLIGKVESFPFPAPTKCASSSLKDLKGSIANHIIF